MSDNNNKSPNENGKPPSGNGQPPKKQNLIYLLIASVAIFILINSVVASMYGSTKEEISYNEFMTLVENGKVEKVLISSTQIDITLKESSTSSSLENGEKTASQYFEMPNGPSYYTGLIDDPNMVQFLFDNSVKMNKEIPDNSGMLLSILLTTILPLVLVWVLLSFLFRKMSKGGGPMSVGKSNAKIYVQQETGITFKDVAGEDEAKESLEEVVDFLHNPARYARIGARLPKGALLVGPPGTGKTLLAKAVAGEAKVPFYSLAGSDFIEMYVGVGASRVRDLFKEAGKNAPCIIFIDEIDAIGRSRDSKFGGGNEEREQTLNQLLSEMDGFDTSKGILILAATNRPEILDKALLRPGRFDRRIIVDKPDLKGRVSILKVHAKDVLMDETIDFNAMALATSGAVGSDLANMINEGAINAVKEGRECVTQKDLLDAVEVVLVGKEKKDRVLSKQERKIVSYHEVGHALVSALQKNSEPVQKITIIPRTMGALGYVMHVPEEEKYLNSEAELRAMLVSLVAGRAAEEIVFDTVTTGASNDIEKATNIAKAMITQYGMSKRFGLVGLATVESQYLHGGARLNCSEETSAGIDEEIGKMLKESYEEAKKMLTENREVMDEIAAYLIEKETILGKEFMEIFRRAKGIPEPVVEAKPEEAKKEKSDDNSTVKNKETDSKSEQTDSDKESDKGDESNSDEKAEKSEESKTEDKALKGEELNSDEKAEKSEESNSEDKAIKGDESDSVEKAEKVDESNTEDNSLKGEESSTEDKADKHEDKSEDNDKKNQSKAKSKFADIYKDRLYKEDK